jgi:hypothetical protein
VTPGLTPDGVPCRHCGQPIFWDEICWVHSNGFADCGLIIQGENVGGLIIDPEIIVDPTHKEANHRAEPVGPWS